MQESCHILHKPSGAVEQRGPLGAIVLSRDHHHFTVFHIPGLIRHPLGCAGGQDGVGETPDNPAKAREGWGVVFEHNAFVGHESFLEYPDLAL